MSRKTDPHANAPSETDVLEALARLSLPEGGDPVSAGLIKALRIEGEAVSFVLEAPNPDAAQALSPLRSAAEAAVAALPGVEIVRIVLTAHGPAPAKRPDQMPPSIARRSVPPASARPKGPKEPSLKIGRHPRAQEGPMNPSGVERILAIGSGKGGVGKSTLSSNLAVALARAGRRVGLLDADIYGPSQPRMMGVSGKPPLSDDKVMQPLEAFGVKVMSLGLMLEEDRAVVWRGPMLMGALQQMLTQVNWGNLDALLVDLPPGTGDVAMTLCQRAEVTGAVVVSTPQDVALIDARKAIDMFQKLDTNVLGLIENMSTYTCEKCGHEAHIFGEGGVERAAEDLGLPFLGALPISLETRLAGDEGRPIAAGEGPMAEAFERLAARFIAGGMA
ncbi:MAG: Mrp/NBP35 family ATP-binding protein [Pseudomonadota bacterium]